MAASHGCGISIPQPGMEPTLLAVEVWSLNCWTARQVHIKDILFMNNRYAAEQFKQYLKKIIPARTSVAIQWLRLHVPSAGGTGSIPGWGTEIPHAA